MTTSLPKASRRAVADQPRAAVYCRMSSDPTGRALGVERQREDCHAVAARHGWHVVGTCTDNDVSAYSGKPRPQYATLVATVTAGEVDAVVAWDPDRLHRSPAELETFTSAWSAPGSTWSPCRPDSGTCPPPTAG